MLPSPALRLAVPIEFIVLAHAAVYAERPQLILYAFAAYGILQAAIIWRSGGPSRSQHFWIGTAGASLAIALAAQLQPGIIIAAVMLPSLLLNLVLLVVFARTLAPGREPLITRFCRLDLGEVPARLVTYTRRLTMIWVGVFAAMATASTALGLLGSPQAWSWTANIACPALAATLFLSEHLWRRLRFPECGPASPVATLRLMMKPESWAEDRC